MVKLNRHIKKLRKQRPMKLKQYTPNPKLKKLALAIAITLVAAILYIQLAPHTQESKQRVQLENTQLQLKKTINQLELQKVQDAETLKKLEETNKQLQETQKQLEAKRHAATVYAAELARPKPVVKAPVAVAPVSGSCADWMAQAGIPNTYATNKLIINESGCRPNAVNPSSGACGIPQALPCSKMGCSLSDPVCQLRWMDRYVKDRYGTWEAALAAWNSRYPHWY